MCALRAAVPPAARRGQKCGSAAPAGKPSTAARRARRSTGRLTRRSAGRRQGRAPLRTLQRSEHGHAAQHCSRRGCGVLQPAWMQGIALALALPSLVAAGSRASACHFSVDVMLWAGQALLRGDDSSATSVRLPSSSCKHGHQASLPRHRQRLSFSLPRHLETLNLQASYQQYDVEDIVDALMALAAAAPSFPALRSLQLLRIHLSEAQPAVLRAAWPRGRCMISIY